MKPKVKIIGDGPLAVGIRSFFKQSEDYDILWVCHDIEVDTVPMRNAIHNELFARNPKVVLVSSQVPSGTIAKLEMAHPGQAFAYSPENVRETCVAADFQNQPRIIVGVRNVENNLLLRELLAPHTEHVVFTSVETAEFVKHALNGFLALSVVYANELAIVAAKTGADMNDVTQALRTDPRIGPRAYLSAGLPYGKNLEREVKRLNEMARWLDVPLLHGIQSSNELHKNRQV